MSGKKDNRRTSILKKERFGEFDEPTETLTKKKLVFSQKKEVREFDQCDEQLTIWRDKYEASLTKSEGSSEGSSVTRRASTDFNSMHISTHYTSSSTTTSNMIEADKENVNEDPSSTIGESQKSHDFSKRISDEPSSLPELSIFLNSLERGNLKEFPPANLNITGMALASPLPNRHVQSIVQANQVLKVLTPLKAYFNNGSSEVTVKDTFLSEPGARDVNLTINLLTCEGSSEEAQRPIEKVRKTVLHPIDMDISLLQDEILQQNLKTTPFFKFPEIPKDMKYRKSKSDSPPIKSIVNCEDKEDLDEIYDIILKDTPSKNLCCLTPQKSASKNVSRVVSKSKQLFGDVSPSESRNVSRASSVNDTRFSNSSMDILNDVNDDTGGTLDATDVILKQAARLIKNPNATLGTLARTLSVTSLDDNTLIVDESINVTMPSTKGKASNDTANMSIDAPPLAHVYKNDERNDDSMEISFQSEDEVTKTDQARPRVTTYEHEMSLNEPASCKMVTIESADAPRLLQSSVFYKHVEEQQLKSRATIYDLQGMDESHYEKSRKIPASLLVSQRSLTTSNRKTVFDENAMEETFSENSQNALFRPLARATIFEVQNMDETTMSIAHVKNCQVMEESVNEEAKVETDSIDASPVAQEKPKNCRYDIDYYEEEFPITVYWATTQEMNERRKKRQA